MGRATATADQAREAVETAGAALGQAIDALREVLGLSVPDLADRIQRDRSHLWRVLNGEVTATADIAARCLRELANVVEYQKAASRG